ncbi:MAG: ribosome silencing factor [Rickettsiales bacterium]|nr:ribosome silencing factor [Rickettsiales bacterium]|tara:strand:- start:312 stop:680 length:369 start_codon:yes stop_codon:yes gene_type:complete
MGKKLEKTLEEIIKFADEKQAEDIKVFHVAENLWITDYIIILGVKNNIHSKSLITGIEKELKKMNLNRGNDFFDPLKVSGNSDSGWVILDINSIIIHCVDSETRLHYDIDTLFEKQGVTYHY